VSPDARGGVFHLGADVVVDPVTTPTGSAASESDESGFSGTSPVSFQLSPTNSITAKISLWRAVSRSPRRSAGFLGLSDGPELLVALVGQSISDLEKRQPLHS